MVVCVCVWGGGGVEKRENSDHYSKFLVCVCARACVRACVCVCARALGGIWGGIALSCACACVRMCMCVPSLDQSKILVGILYTQPYPAFATYIMHSVRCRVKQLKSKSAEKTDRTDKGDRL